MKRSIFDDEETFEGLLSHKWALDEAHSAHSDLLPLWVADMDFKTAAPIRRELKARAGRGVYGYPIVTEAYRNAVIGWFNKKHDWRIATDSIIQTPGVVTALHVIIGALSQEGDGVIVQRPAYPPFARTIREMNRMVVDNPLREKQGKYAVNIDHLETLVRSKENTLLILCNPHNPTGKVFTRTELEAIASLCARHGVLVIADELHCDIVFSGVRHIPFQTISEQAAHISAACTAPSKTFNLAGLKNSNIVIPDTEIRRKIIATSQYFGIPQPALFPLVAGEVAYRAGARWQGQCVRYLEANRDFALDFFAEYLPRIRVQKPQATYFLWLDFHWYGLSPERLERVLLDEAGVWLNQGHTFGEQSSGFVRLNVACPRGRLAKALERLRNTFATGKQQYKQLF